MRTKLCIKKSVLVLAIAGMPALVQAAGLGRLNVLSSLGQPFRAELELVSLQPGELEKLLVKLASPENHAAARIAYPDPALGLRLAVSQRNQGRHVVQITSRAAIDEPVFSLLVDLAWPGGSLRRQYTALLDPAGYGPPAGSAEAGRQAARSAVVVRPLPEPAAMPAPATQAPAPRSGNTVYVNRGDTLYSIARAVRPKGVSQDQAMAGLYRANRSAFSGGMNTLQFGRVLRIPSAKEFAAVSQQQVQRQGVSVPAGKPVAGLTAGVAAAGAVLPRERIPAVAASGPQMASQPVAVMNLQQELAARKLALDEARQRVLVLQQDIRKLEALAASPASAVQAAVPAGQMASAADAVPAQPAVAASTGASAVKPRPKRVLPAPPTAEPGLLDTLFDNIVPIGGGLAAVMLGAAGLLWSRKRRLSAATPASEMAGVMELPMPGKADKIAPKAGTIAQGDFDAHPLGSIDTGEVDPVAAAEVYLACGRDHQAEEVLADALQNDPLRQELRMKLLDIYLARKDRMAFAAMAAELHEATGGQGPLWEQVLYHGRKLDPDNPLYARKEPDLDSEAKALAAGAAAGAGLAALSSQAQAGEPEPQPGGDSGTKAPDRLVTSLDSEAGEDIEPVTDSGEASPEDEDGLMALDLPAGTDSEPGGQASAAQPALAGAEPEPLSLDLPGLELDLRLDELPAAEEAEYPPEATEPDSGGLSLEEIDLDFDFKLDTTIENDLAGLPAGQATSGEEAAGDVTGDSGPVDEAALQTRIELARAYLDMGDAQTAREMLEEVLQAGSPALQESARALLAELGPAD